VPHRLHVITVPSSDHFQHVGQQTLITTAHSRQGNPARCAAFDARCHDRDRISAVGESGSTALLYWVTSRSDR
jgi:hypothetical protein